MQEPPPCLPKMKSSLRRPDHDCCTIARDNRRACRMRQAVSACVETTFRGDPDDHELRPNLNGAMHCLRRRLLVNVQSDLRRLDELLCGQRW